MLRYNLMKSDILRQKFLRFFEKKRHKIWPSAPLVPENDPTLLFTGAGMNQFKEYFLAKAKPPAPRMATYQKCLRTVDMEKVGRTPGHHTFFEMLGNFSFGDYFKKEAIAWAWEFLVEELKIPQERLSVSVYEDDQESYDIWHQEVGLPPEKIFKFGAKDNFWPANAPEQGPNGPCGPCSEIFYDWGPEYGCGLPSCTVGCDCHRFVEVWNLVFMEYNRQENGDLEPLPKKNIDTGMGLERLAAILQKVTSNFEIDIFQPIIKEIADVLKVTYEPTTEEGARIKRIADHIRALTFLGAEGIIPANEGRGYILRRILRRAARDGMTLGMKKPFLYKLVPVVVEVMKGAYPELAERHQNIARMIKAEEAKFLETVEAGIVLLEEIIAKMSVTGEKVFPGDEAFKLYDTYGFPIDLTESILAERGFKLDIAGYEKAMQEQRERARAFSKIAQEVFAYTPIAEVKNILKQTEFLGYKTLESPVKIEAILVEGRLVGEAPEKTEVSIITDQSPFYGEAGGQVGDTGHFKAEGIEVVINDTQRVEGYLIHLGKVKRGIIKQGSILQATVDPVRRGAIARNHTATHLLQHALRQILGAHVEQSGSLVAPDRLRFDFTHFSAPTKEELNAVEDMVNERIMRNSPVEIKELSLAEAKRQGALAFFGEKYGETVRMVKIGDYSRELCAGTHVNSTGEIGFFKITTESSIASGVRRIEALTGTGASKLVREQENLIQDMAGLLETTPARIIDKTKSVLGELKDLKRELARYARTDNMEMGKTLLKRAREIMGVKVISETIAEKSIDDLRLMADYLRAQPEPLIALLATTQNKRVNLVIALTAHLTSRGFDGRRLIKEVARIIGGSGGGRADLAQAGGKDIARLDEALNYFVQVVANQLK